MSDSQSDVPSGASLSSDTSSSSPSSSSGSGSGSGSGDVVYLDTSTAPHVPHALSAAERAAAEEEDDEAEAEAGGILLGADSDPEDQRAKLAAFVSELAAGDPRLASATAAALNAAGGVGAGSSGSGGSSGSDADEGVAEVQAFIHRQEALSRQAAAAAAGGSSSADAKADFKARVAARQAELRAHQMANEEMESHFGRMRGRDEDEEGQEEEGEEEDGEAEDGDDEDEPASRSQSFLPWMRSRATSWLHSKRVARIRAAATYYATKTATFGGRWGFNLLTAAFVTLVPLGVMEALETNKLQQQKRFEAITDEALRNYVESGIGQTAQGQDMYGGSMSLTQ